MIVGLWKVGRWYWQTRGMKLKVIRVKLILFGEFVCVCVCMCFLVYVLSMSLTR